MTKRTRSSYQGRHTKEAKCFSILGMQAYFQVSDHGSTKMIELPSFTKASPKGKALLSCQQPSKAKTFLES